MNKYYILPIKLLLIFLLTVFYSYKVYADETDTILKQLLILQEDIKTLEKAVYSKDVNTTSNIDSASSALTLYEIELKLIKVKINSTLVKKENILFINFNI